MQVFINNTAGSCYQSKEKALSSNTLGRMQIWTRKSKMENLIDDDLEKNDTDESDSDSNDENDESNEWFVKKLKKSILITMKA